MGVNSYLLAVLLVALLVILYLLSKLHRVREQLSIIRDALQDIKDGNLNRRVLTRKGDMTKQICYDLNAIAVSNQSRLIQQKQSEQAYKRLMTSLSHDVKTPLASLVGYLEAIENEIVVGEEKDKYVHVAMDKAHHLKSFVEALFEWVKLDGGEQLFHFELCDLNELSHDIVADWITTFESNNFEYEIDIPETEYNVRIDANAYTRILNNLFQNVIHHSGGSELFFKISENEEKATISVVDNGKGIPATELPHVFERMYQGDYSRSGKGNGLGLSIAKELVSIHGGTVSVSSVLTKGTTLTVTLPKAL
ncbi:MAG: HAMP domain-containing sensor histidine kinase [Hespellia sp.]|nr:HAMP domain-containing sensor histidine kinase [Hespellia sp.]